MRPTPILAAQRILDRPAEVLEQQWSTRDTIVYNLGIGFGEAATRDPRLLRFVLEDRVVTFPSMSSVLAVSQAMYRDEHLGIDFSGILHGEESIDLTKPLPAAGNFVSRTSVEGLWDRGPEKGAILAVRKVLHDAADGTHVVTCRTVLILRRNGGFGGTAAGAPSATALPERHPDGALELTTRPEQALIYRLSGDTNPLHAIPETAAQSGFPRPILHGLCTLGIAARALVQAVADGDETRVVHLGVRFSGVVFPGEAIQTEYWNQGAGEYVFRARVPARDVVVLTSGRAVVRR